MRLCERIASESLWPALEQAAVQTVTAGGMAAMGFYRDAWARQSALADAKNPSTLADVSATFAILQTCHTLLAPLARKLPCALSFLGEETSYADLLAEQLPSEVRQLLHPAERFFAAGGGVLRVIIDGIDGTANFNRGIPLFCSAVGLLVEDQVRVAAVYDPIHHQVYSATLPGPHDDPDAGASASAWQIASGVRVDLVDEARTRERRELSREAVATHFTRSRPELLKRFLRPESGRGGPGMLERLASACGGIYALNSGVVAMTEVARGSLGGFVNVITNPWDTAAGEVLVRACGGVVTDFDGEPLRYDSPGQISVVAAKRHLHAEIRRLLRA